MKIHSIEAAYLRVAMANLGRDIVEKECGSLSPQTLDSAVELEEIQDGTYYKIAAFLKRLVLKVFLRSEE